MTEPGVVLVVPVKRLAEAKSRLEVHPGLRRLIALSMAEHTVRTAAATPSVARVLVVTRDRTVKAAVLALGAEVVHERRRSSLNRAARAGRAAARRRLPGHAIGIIVSDLPTLTCADLESAIAEFRECRTPIVVPDQEGTGTTMLLQGSEDLPIRFGPSSAARHAEAGFRPADGALPGLRRDLDRLPPAN